VTSLNLFGYAIAFAAVLWYNYQKLQAMKAPVPALSKDEESAALLNGTRGDAQANLRTNTNRTTPEKA
jgi:hypothetical protein